MTLSELTESIDGNYDSLAVLLGKWTRWHYISYRSDGGKRRYRILSKGLGWLSKWDDYITPEFLQWPDYQRGEYD